MEDLYDYPQDQRGRLFTGAARDEFTAFLRERLDPAVPGAPYADQPISSAVAPSKQLLAVAADEVQRRERFVLLDRQKLAHSIVLHEVERARRADHKAVVLVTGVPGSGKSVIALSLFGELSRRGRAGTARDRVALLHADAAQDRGGAETSGAEDVQVFQPVHGRRADAHDDDRHVLAAAVHARANVLITENTKHFNAQATPGAQTLSVERMSKFLGRLLDKRPADVVQAMQAKVDHIDMSRVRCRPCWTEWPRKANCEARAEAQRGRAA